MRDEIKSSTVTVQKVRDLSVSILKTTCRPRLVLSHPVLVVCLPWSRLAMLASSLFESELVGAGGCLPQVVLSQFLWTARCWDKDSGEIYPCRDRLETSYDYVGAGGQENQFLAVMG